jgi:hypothetical protein
MIKILLIIVLLLNIQCSATDLEQTNALHKEVANHKNHNVTIETHPILYKMVEDLIAKAKITMPRYITIYDAEYHVVSKSGIVQSEEKDMHGYIDFLGDLHLCRFF